MTPKLSLLIFILCFPILNGQPSGFTSLFNGKDLTGWWGLGTENPSSWMNLPAQELAIKKKR